MISSAPAVRVVWSDLGESIYVTWVWEGASPQVEVIGSRQANRVKELLDEALPRGGLGESADVDRCLSGPLSTPVRSLIWAGELAAALLPQRLTAQIVSRSSGTGLIDMMIMPSGTCASVPWEILSIEGHHLLLDVATVTHFAPVTQREFAGIPPNRWRSDRERAPLWVIDPRISSRSGGHVLGTGSRREWAEYLQGLPGIARVGVDYDRIELSQDLLADASQPSLVSGVERFFYLGHVVADDAQSTALLLGCGRSVYAASRSTARQRGFSAQDALVGTIDFDSGDQLHGGGSPRFPAAALDPQHKIREVPGRELWPMPARVALIACGSGTDFRYPEPFGLVTAFFEAGAELITATRWTLLTDWAFACRAGHSGERRPLNEVARVVDAAHAGTTPVADIAAWQRHCLERWRADGDLADSPLTWAALATHLWRPRANPLPPGLAGLFDKEAIGA